MNGFLMAGGGRQMLRKRAPSDSQLAGCKGRPPTARACATARQPRRGRRREVTLLTQSGRAPGDAASPPGHRGLLARHRQSRCVGSGQVRARGSSRTGGAQRPCMQRAAGYRRRLARCRSSALHHAPSGKVSSEAQAIARTPSACRQHHSQGDPVSNASMAAQGAGGRGFEQGAPVGGLKPGQVQRPGQGRAAGAECFGGLTHRPTPVALARRHRRCAGRAPARRRSPGRFAIDFSELCMLMAEPLAYCCATSFWYSASRAGPAACASSSPRKPNRTAPPSSPAPNSPVGRAMVNLAHRSRPAPWPCAPGP